MQFRQPQLEDKSEYVSRQLFTRYASKKYINTYQKHVQAINACLMTFEAKRSVNLISKLGVP